MNEQSNQVTALIPAFNAQRTIARAIGSARHQVDQVIVLDDGSSDATAATVEKLKDDKVRLLRCSANRGIGAGRQLLLEACHTEFAIWLDADDEFLPGRVERLRALMTAGIDMVFDDALLVDDLSGKLIRRLKIPGYVLQRDGLLWQLARNFIPSIGWGMMRTATALAIGYRAEFRQAEDYDFFVRALINGVRMDFCAEPGCRHFHSDQSVSRNIDLQNHYSEKALGDLDALLVKDMIFGSSLSSQDKNTIWAYFLARIHDWQALQTFTAEEPAEDGILQFFSGVAAYQLGDFKQAVIAFKQSLSLTDSACANNNLGVSLLKSGSDLGMTYIDKALAMMPEYRDAKLNRQGDDLRLTPYPLRLEPLREMYP